MQNIWLNNLRIATISVVILTFFTAFSGAVDLMRIGKKNIHRVNQDVSYSNEIVLDTPGVGDTLVYPIEDYVDPTSKPHNPFDLENPSNIQSNVEYDPETGEYIFTETVGDNIKFRNPSGMTLEEYKEYDMSQAKSDYWRDKVQEQSEEERGLIPPIKIKGDLFENIFGSNEINIRPQGTAQLSFGVNSNKYDNPQIPEKQRRVTTFDFQQQIQLNVVGQIGDKLKLTTSYNTEATFDFQNNVKLEYTGYEDEIIQKIELGNVSMPLNTSLINGAQSLFGVKTQLRFGKLDITSIFSQQRGQRQEINIEGGARVQDFEVEADDYEANKHYFLNYYHRNNYDRAMTSLPVVSSNVKITKIEVWVTNNRNNTTDTRNILAFTDLGESDPNNVEGTPGSYNGDPLPQNESNGLYAWASNNPTIRAFNNSVQELSIQGSAPGPFVQSRHYEKVENARRLAPEEFTYNSLLGFVSLNSPLNQDQVLGIAYQYTYQGKTYQVGEFSTDGVTGQDALIVKLLKPTIINPQLKVWDLMMKNVYAIGAYQLSPEQFKLEVLYNNPETSTQINYMPHEGVNDRLLIQLLDMDRLNQNNQQSQDGTFDFAPMTYNGNEAISGGTINPQNGRVYFSTIEPFGKTLREKMETSTTPIAPLVIDNIAFEELYDSTKIAAQQIPGKNRFVLKGQYQSSVSDEIYLNALNIPEGSVKVTAGGVNLVENVDYTVDYNLGRVKILNQGILESQTPIKIALESNTAFGFKSKSLFGTRLDYRFSKDFNIGATIMNMTEKPLTGKVTMNDEPIRNTVIGADINYRTDAPILTKIVDAIPLLNTKAPSSLTASAEIAYLIPGTSRVIKENGGTSYVDAFEGSQSTIDIRSFSQWRLASVPQGQPDLFPEGDLKNDLTAGYNRASMAWYVIDPLFHQDNNLTPDHIKDDPDMLSDSRMRLVLQTQLFPQLDQAQGSLGNIPILDVAFYPSLRGQYNYDVGSSFSSGIDQDGTLRNPSTRWGGIMRSLNTTNFEEANVEYIQFWVLDPFNSDADSLGVNQGGDLYFNLGNVSEDILPDSRKSFENGLPTSSTPATSDFDTTNWARVPTQQVVVNAFDNNNVSRQFQDVGLDGFSDEKEREMYKTFVDWAQNNLPPNVAAQIANDPSNDNYNYFRDDDYDAVQANILERYIRYNGMEGNSPTTEMSDTMNADGYPTQASNRPDVEDINQDNNLSESESYFQYRVSMRPGDTVVGQNHITNVTLVPVPGTTKIEKWYQFKIPVRKPDKIVNGIQDFRSIRFIRMFTKGFDHPVLFRFAKLELVRGEWRRYQEDIQTAGPTIPDDPNAGTFNIGALNVEENDQRDPIPYKIPPGIERQQDVTTANLRQLNEQSLVLDVCGLQDGNARAAYKNVSFDIRSYKKLRMFVHGEAIAGSENIAEDDDVTVFIRLGTDFTENYYEYEMPVKMTDFSASTAEQIWPEENNMVITFTDLTDAKKIRNLQMNDPNSGVSLQAEYIVQDPLAPDRRIKVKGSPNLQGIKLVMIGIRNPKKSENNPWKPDDGLSKCVNIWVNELRLTDFNQSGGWASTARLTLQMADFANISLAGNYSTPNWGGIDAKVSERQRDTRASIDIASTFQMGNFFGKKVGLQMPLFFGYSVGVITPEYDPLNPDIKFDEYTGGDKEDRLKISRDFTERKSVNLTNIRRQRPNGKENRFWDIENISLSFAWSEVMRRDFNIEYDRTETWRGGLNYTFNGNPKLWEPFKNMKGVRSNKWLKWVRDFNIYLGPKVISFNGDVLRSYNERKVRNVLDTIFEFQPTYLKNFQVNRNYNFKYDISKSIKFDFNAVNNGIFTEPDGMIDKSEDAANYDAFQDSIQRDLPTLGRTMHYAHNMNVTVNFPFNQFPLTDWINATGRYSSGYDWQRAPLGQDSLGHLLQNNRMLSINAQLNFTTLYNKIDFFKRVNQGNRGVSSRGSLRSRLQSPTENEKDDDKKKKKDKKKKEKKELGPVVKTLARIIMTVRNASFTYSLNDGIMLPGYTEETRLLGFNGDFSAPSPGFVFGQQNTDWFGQERRNFAGIAAENGWIIDNVNLNTQHTVNHSLTWNGRLTLEPFKDLRIDLSIDRNNSENKAEYFRYNDTLIGPEGQAGYWESQNTKITGMLTFSTISLGSAFEKWDDETYVSEIFQKMRDNRSGISQLLGEQQSFSVKEGDYYTGFGPEQQDVIIGAFITTYTSAATGKNSINPFKAIPLPNWNVTYDGLSKFKFMKKFVRNFSITHGYRSTFTLANYQTNLFGGFDEVTNLPNFDQAGNFIPELQTANAVISEQFSPLIGFDATWTIKGQGLITKFEWKKDRNIMLSLANNQITEVKGNEIVIGAGYKFPKVKMPFKLLGKKVESDLNIRVDLSFRENVTVIRKIVENSNQATAGQNVVSIKTAIDYNLSENLNIRLFYDQNINKPVVGTSYPSSNINAGLALRINLAQ